MVTLITTAAMTTEIGEAPETAEATATAMTIVVTAMLSSMITVQTSLTIVMIVVVVKVAHVIAITSAGALHRALLLRVLGFDCVKVPTLSRMSNAIDVSRLSKQPNRGTR